MFILHQNEHGTLLSQAIRETESDLLFLVGIDYRVEWENKVKFYP